ncbi:MAG: hypothetical protein U0L77_07945 [Prevotellamassilia sp.]|nr:hypothetical protein [Prevotellamassilia sp.]
MVENKVDALHEIYFLIGISACEDENDTENVTIVIPTFRSYKDYEVTGDYTDVSFYSKIIRVGHEVAERFFELVDIFNDGQTDNLTIEIL